MLNRRLMAQESRQTHVRWACAVLIALAFCFFAQTGGTANAMDKRAKFGRIEISTNPGGYPILIDGRPYGNTSSTPQLIDLEPGRHTVEVLMPNDARWVREFNVVAGKKQCVVINYRAKRITVNRPCPYPVTVAAPPTVNEGDVITFTSDVDYSGSNPLTYTWTISPASARIISGAGTPTITVDSTGVGRQRVSAVLSVDDGSGDPSCRANTGASTDVIPVPPPNKPPSREFDEFPSVAFDDDKARLDNLAIELQSAPDSTGYVIAYAGQRSRPGQAARLMDRARDYLVNQRGLDPSRLIFINGGYRERDFWEFWIVPQGAEPPQATPTVEPGSVRPAPERPSRRAPRRRTSRRRR